MFFCKYYNNISLINQPTILKHDPVFVIDESLNSPLLIYSNLFSKLPEYINKLTAIAAKKKNGIKNMTCPSFGNDRKIILFSNSWFVKMNIERPIMISSTPMPIK